MSAVAITFATLDELQTILGEKEKLARAILSVRENSGNITPDVLLTLTRGKIPYNVIDNIDFTFDEALADEEDSLFETLEFRVKKYPSEGLRAQWVGGGGAASLFASAHKASENLGTLKGFTTPSLFLAFILNKLFSQINVSSFNMHTLCDSLMIEGRFIYQVKIVYLRVL